MHTFSRTVTYTRVTRWPSFSACSGGLPRAVRKRSVLCGGARAQGSPRPAWSGVWPVISITTHTSTLKQPSPPPSPSPMADTPRTVPAVLPRSPRARTTARALLASSASIPITLTLYRCVVVSRCISLYRGVVVSPCILPSCCIVVSLYLVCPVVSLYRCLSPCISLCRCISPSRCIVVSLYNVRPS
jgi:hypothetical protein